MMAGSDITMTVVALLGALLAVIGLMLIMLVVAKKWLRHTPSIMGGRLIQVVASHPMGMKKSIALVQVPGAVLVVGVAGDRMTRLGTVTDPDVLSQIEDHTRQRPSSFVQHLKYWRNRTDPPADPPPESPPS